MSAVDTKLVVTNSPRKLPKHEKRDPNKRILEEYLKQQRAFLRLIKRKIQHELCDY
jgi:hypothetical protein